MANYSHSPVLFVDFDGASLEFCMRNAEPDIRDMIEYGGGLLVSNHLSSSKAIQLVKPGTKALNFEPGKRLVSVQYIYDCVNDNVLLDIKDYAIKIETLAVKDIRDEDSAVIVDNLTDVDKNNSEVANKNLDDLLLNWVIKCVSDVPVVGDDLYKAVCNKCEQLRCHSHKFLHSRMLNNVLPNISGYNISDSCKRNILRLYTRENVGNSEVVPGTCNKGSEVVPGTSNKGFEVVPGTSNKGSEVVPGTSNQGSEVVPGTSNKGSDPDLNSCSWGDESDHVSIFDEVNYEPQLKRPCSLEKLHSKEIHDETLNASTSVIEESPLMVPNANCEVETQLVPTVGIRGTKKFRFYENSTDNSLALPDSLEVNRQLTCATSSTRHPMDCNSAGLPNPDGSVTSHKNDIASKLCMEIDDNRENVSSSQDIENIDNYDKLMLSKLQHNEKDAVLSQSFTVSSTAEENIQPSSNLELENNHSAEVFPNSSTVAPDSPQENIDQLSVMRHETFVNKVKLVVQNLNEKVKKWEQKYSDIPSKCIINEIDKLQQIVSNSSIEIEAANILNKKQKLSANDRLCLIKYCCLVNNTQPEEFLQKIIHL